MISINIPTKKDTEKEIVKLRELLRKEFYEEIMILKNKIIDLESMMKNRESINRGYQGVAQ